MNFKEEAERLEQELIDVRRHLHQNPELSLEEKETTDFLEEELKKLGLTTHRFKDRYGVWADIDGEADQKDTKDNNEHKRTVLLRADIDALPLQEQTGLPFASCRPGVMHACGHDSHAAMLLTAGKILVRHKESLPGRVRLLFQAAEETSHGAEYYVNAGLLDDVDAVYGTHVWAAVPSPYINIEEGPRMSSCDNFTITVTGKAAHGSMPNLGVDAVVVAAAIILQIQTIVSRQTDPRNSLTITIGEIAGGTRSNIIAGKVVMKGTVRTHSNAVRDSIEEKLRRIIELTAQAHGAQAELDYCYLPSVLVNDPAMTEIAQKSAIRLFGEDVLVHEPAAMGSEDFSYYLDKVPGVFTFLGIRNEEKGLLPEAHNPYFDVDESVLKRGAALYAQFAYDYLNGTFSTRQHVSEEDGR